MRWYKKVNFEKCHYKPTYALYYTQFKHQDIMSIFMDITLCTDHDSLIFIVKLLILS